MQHPIPTRQTGVATSHRASVHAHSIQDFSAAHSGRGLRTVLKVKSDGLTYVEVLPAGQETLVDKALRIADKIGLLMDKHILRLPADMQHS